MAISSEILKTCMTRCFIETGTGSGSGIRLALDAGFPEIRSVDALASCSKSARDKFRYHPVSIYEGESQVILSEMLSDIDEPVTIFLDAHYSGPGSFMGNVHSPLMEELEILKKHEINNHILLIDDYNLFGLPEVPNLNREEVKKKVLEINSEYSFEDKGNLLICKAPIRPAVQRKVISLERMQVDNVFPYIEKLLKSVDKPIFFEVGAANGEDTERIAKISPEARYFAFEPDTRNIEAFKARNIQNVKLIESAVGSYNGKTIFYMSSGTNPTFGYEHTLSSSIKRPRKHLEVFPWCKFEKIVNANICTIDRFCKDNKVKYIDFLWADIQGAESDMIKGATKMLANTAYVYLEYVNTPMYDNQYTIDQLLSLLGSNFEEVHRFSGDVLLKNKNMML